MIKDLNSFPPGGGWGVKRVTCFIFLNIKNPFEKFEKKEIFNSTLAGKSTNPDRYHT